MDAQLAKRRDDILNVIDDFGTQKAFAEAIDMDPSRISRALNKDHVSDRRLAPIERAIAKLQSGQGDGDSGEVPEPPVARANPASEKGLPPREVRRLSDEELAERDLYRVRRISVQAGRPGAELVFLNERGEEEVLTGSYIRRKYSIQPHRLAEVVVHGESMNGPPANVAPGSVLRVAMMEDTAQVQTGAVYVVYGPDGYQLKRLRIEEEPQEDRTVERFVWLWSDNEAEGRVRLPVEVWERDYEVVAMALTVENSL